MLASACESAHLSVFVLALILEKPAYSPGLLLCVVLVMQVDLASCDRDTIGDRHVG